MIEEKLFFTSSDNLRLCGIFTTPDKETTTCIVLCHVITADKDEDGIFAELAHALTNAGFAVFRFDFRAHGESEGNSLELSIAGETKDLNAAIGFMEERGYQTFGLLGASFGGGAASFSAADNAKKIKAIVLWNAAIDYSFLINSSTPWAQKFFGKKAGAKVLLRGYTEVGSTGYKVGRKVMQEIVRLKPWKALTALTCPILFVHGDKDTYVPYSDSVKYASQLSHASLATIPGAEHGFHDRKKDSEQAITATLAFF